MAIRFYPRAGQIFICDFSKFQAPEMTKKRPVMVISPRLKYRSEIVAIVPLSTTPPRETVAHVVLLSRDYSPVSMAPKQVWAKCDMLLNVSRQRLSSYKTGRRKYVTPEATGDDLRRVREGVKAALGFS